MYVSLIKCKNKKRLYNLHHITRKIANIHILHFTYVHSYFLLLTSYFFTSSSTVMPSVGALSTSEIGESPTTSAVNSKEFAA